MRAPDNIIFFSIALLATEYGGVLPGSACGPDVNTVVEHAMVELYSHSRAFEKMKKIKNKAFDNIIEARLHHFGTNVEGYLKVKARIQVGKSFVPAPPETVFSNPISGPWNPGVNVYRVLLNQSIPFMVDGVERFLI